jgi:D-arabinose 1-dehydrogenase-like Zn-dependent alcohol dehydrogenase
MRRQSLVAYGSPLKGTIAEIPAPSGSEVLVRVTHCGVCHSDIHLQDGCFELGNDKRLDVRAGRELPFTLGHEIAGVVEAVGPRATGVTIGERFAVYPWIGCGQCALCGRGDEHLCHVPRALGVTVDGGFASHVLVPHPNYLLNVDGVAPELAGSFMCSGLTAYSALKKARPFLRGGPLLIVGLGGVGMMGLQFARALVSAPILVADIDPGKRAAAMMFGASDAFDPFNADVRKSIAKVSSGGVGAVIDFVGSEISLRFAYGVIGKCGAAIVVGLMGGSFTVPVPMFPLRALAIMGSYVGSLAEAHEMLQLVKSGSISPIPVDLRALETANTALDDLRHGRVLGRVVLTP